MIYEFPQSDAPVRQGDVFANIPRAEISLRNMILVRDTELEEIPWQDVANDKARTDISIVVPVTPVWAIVVSQDCDIARGADVTLCEIRSFTDVEGKAKNANSEKAWVNIITQHSRQNLKWFYLPPDTQIGFSKKMAVSFALTIRVPRADLEDWRHFRKGRLNSTADEHFRERLSEYFRRYPYDEWYPLTIPEFEHYQKQTGETIQPFPWQVSDRLENNPE